MQYEPDCQELCNRKQWHFLQAMRKNFDLADYFRGAQQPAHRPHPRRVRADGATGAAVGKALRELL